LFWRGGPGFWRAVLAITLQKTTGLKFPIVIRALTHVCGNRAAHVMLFAAASASTSGFRRSLAACGLDRLQSAVARRIRSFVSSRWCCSSSGNSPGRRLSFIITTRHGSWRPTGFMQLLRVDHSPSPGWVANRTCSCALLRELVPAVPAVALRVLSPWAAVIFCWAPALCWNLRLVRWPANDPR